MLGVDETLQQLVAVGAERRKESIFGNEGKSLKYERSDVECLGEETASSSDDTHYLTGRKKSSDDASEGHSFQVNVVMNDKFIVLATCSKTY